MKQHAFVMGILVSALLLGALDCHAEKWDKNDYHDNSIETGFYDSDSIKVAGENVNWTEKYILSKEGSDYNTGTISKHEACKKRIAQKGAVAQLQIDYQVENNRKFKGVAKRYYNKNNELLCTDKDTGKDFDTSFHKIMRGSPIEKALYDLVTRYKVKLQ
jgi:hypothetical protein